MTGELTLPSLLSWKKEKESRGTSPCGPRSRKGLKESLIIPYGFPKKMALGRRLRSHRIHKDLAEKFSLSEKQ